MNRTFFAAGPLALLLLLTNGVFAEDQSPEQQQFVVKVKLCEGLARKNLEKIQGTKTMASPTVVACPNQTFTIHTGGEVPVEGISTEDKIGFVPFGLRIEGRIHRRGEHHLFSDLTISQTSKKSPVNEVHLFETQAARIIAPVKLGKTTKHFFQNATAAKPGSQVQWVEVTIEEVPREEPADALETSNLRK